MSKDFQCYICKGKTKAEELISFNREFHPYAKLKFTDIAESKREKMRIKVTASYCQTHFQELEDEMIKKYGEIYRNEDN